MQIRCINESLTSAIKSSGGLDFQAAYKILRAGVEAIQKSIEIKSGDKEK